MLLATVLHCPMGNWGYSISNIVFDWVWDESTSTTFELWQH